MEFPDSAKVELTLERKLLLLLLDLSLDFYEINKAQMTLMHSATC